MRAIVAKELGPPEKLVIEELPPLEAGPGQVVIDNRAAANQLSRPAGDGRQVPGAAAAAVFARQGRRRGDPLCGRGRYPAEAGRPRDGAGGVRLLRAGSAGGRIPVLSGAGRRFLRRSGGDRHRLPDGPFRASGPGACQRRRHRVGHGRFRQRRPCGHAARESLGLRGYRRSDHDGEGKSGAGNAPTT